MQYRPDAGSKGLGAAQSSSLTGRRVVVVEDEGITQMHLQNLLKREGLTVAGAALSGERAVDLVLRELPDVVLMDVNLAGAMNGIEAARQILAQIKTCVVMLTAYPEYAEQAAEIGASGYVLKPVSADTLMPALRRACGLRDG